MERRSTPSYFDGLPFLCHSARNRRGAEYESSTNGATGAACCGVTSAIDPSA